jgi:multidrug resistance efflux pump
MKPLDPAKRRRWFLAAGAVVVVLVLCIVFLGGRRPIVLTGVVTTDDVIVSSEIQGQLDKLLVTEGDTVKAGQLLGTIRAGEWKADLSFYENSERQAAAAVAQAAADLKYQKALTENQIAQAEADVAAADAQVVAAEADAENARLNFERETELRRSGTDSQQAYDAARTGSAGAAARLESARKQAAAARASVGLAKANRNQVVERRAALEAGTRQLAAAGAQKDKAQVQLDYTDIRAPIDGLVDVRAARAGETVNAGQAIVTLVNPDDLWVRADVEEGYIDQIRLGERLTVRLPSGAEREGTVFFRGVDADYATQRDVSRTKRDIKTFEIRLRCDNRDRALALGMTAYVLLPLGRR